MENGFSYFTIRVQQPAASSDVHLTGVIECLSNGERRDFATGEELVRFVADRRAEAKMEPGTGGSNG